MIEFDKKLPKSLSKNMYCRSESGGNYLRACVPQRSLNLPGTYLEKVEHIAFASFQRHNWRGFALLEKEVTIIWQYVPIIRNDGRF